MKESQNYTTVCITSYHVLCSAAAGRIFRMCQSSRDWAQRINNGREARRTPGRKEKHFLGRSSAVRVNISFISFRATHSFAISSFALHGVSSPSSCSGRLSVRPSLAISGAATEPLSPTGLESRVDIACGYPSVVGSIFLKRRQKLGSVALPVALDRPVRSMQKEKQGPSSLRTKLPSVYVY